MCLPPSNMVETGGGALYSLLVLPVLLDVQRLLPLPRSASPSVLVFLIPTILAPRTEVFFFFPSVRAPRCSEPVATHTQRAESSKSSLHWWLNKASSVRPVCSFIVASMGADSEFHQNEISDESCLESDQDEGGVQLLSTGSRAVSDSSEAQTPAKLELLQTAALLCFQCNYETFTER